MNGMVRALATLLNNSQFTAGAAGRALQGLMDQMPEPVAIALVRPDDDLVPRYICDSPSWRARYGIDGDLTGRSHYEIFPAIPDVWKEEHRRGFVDGETSKSEGSVCFYNGNAGGEQCIEYALGLLPKENGKYGLIFLSIDVTEQELSRRRAQQQALTDALTGLASRRAGIRELEKMLGDLNNAG